MKARLIFRLALFVVALCAVVRGLGSVHVKTLQIVGLTGAVTGLAAGFAIPKSSRKEKSED